MVTMPRRSLLPFLIALAFAVSAQAQSQLPPLFEGWKSAQATTARPETLDSFAGEATCVLREYGTLGAERRLYTRGSESLAVTLYQMRDPTAAFGAFSFLRSEEMTPAEIAATAALGRERGLVLVGSLLLEVTGQNVAGLAGDLKVLTSALGHGAAKALYPALSQYVPARGLVPNSDRYLLGPVALNRFLPLGAGDWVGFSNGAEALLARYRMGGQEITLLLVAYPTPQAAAMKLDELGRWFNLNTGEERMAGRPLLFARRSSSLLAVVANSRSAAAAEALLQQIQYETHVTWNEPGHKATDPPLAQILVGTFLGIAVLLIYTLAAGIAMGGLRLVVKRFFPGTIFDREGDIEILQLGLSSKPIDAKDFYQSTAGLVK